MLVSKISTINKSTFMQNSPMPIAEENKTTVCKPEKLTDKFYTGIRNTADMTDTVAVPRSIFKGYLGFIAGTALTSLALLFDKQKTIKKSLCTLGTLGIIYGTFSFVRPYIFKNVKGVTDK